MVNVWRNDSPSPDATAVEPVEWELRLYVTGRTPGCLRAYANLKTICETHLSGRFWIEVVDLQQNPQLAKVDEIIAIPTLVRTFPLPIRKVIGDLSNTERVLAGLQLAPR